MKPRIKKLIRKAYEEYTTEMECVQLPMEGYLGCLFDLGLITYEEYHKATQDIVKAEMEALE